MDYTAIISFISSYTAIITRQLSAIVAGSSIFLWIIFFFFSRAGKKQTLAALHACLLTHDQLLFVAYQYGITIPDFQIQKKPTIIDFHRYIKILCTSLASSFRTVGFETPLIETCKKQYATYRGKKILLSIWMVLLHLWIFFCLVSGAYALYLSSPLWME